MKKPLIFFAMLIICLDVWSQGKLKNQCKFGLKLGSGMHTITGWPVKTHPKPAMTGGMWVQIKITKNWTMQSELTRIDKGTGGFREGREGGNYGDYFLRLTYFEVPILFQYNKQNGYFEFGPSLAGLINVGEYIKGGAPPYQTDLYPFSKQDISFNLGTGYVFNEKWRVGVRLTHSLLPVRKQLPATSHPIYNRGIILAVSRQISFKASKNKHSEDSE